MGYTITWKQLPFTNDTYKLVTDLIPKVINVNFTVEEKGFVVGNNDRDCLFIERFPKQITAVKTNRLPYTKDVMKTLIIMVEYNAAMNLDHDDQNMYYFLEALDEVHAIHYLDSYEEQKEYFNLKS